MINWVVSLRTGEPGERRDGAKLLVMSEKNQTNARLAVNNFENAKSLLLNGCFVGFSVDNEYGSVDRLHKFKYVQVNI